MQQEGQPQFIRAHTGFVKGVAFNPKERYIFCSGGTDGKLNVYDALQGQHIMSVKVTSAHAMRNVNAVKFNADGSRIISATSKRLSVIDTERGEQISFYDNCAYSGKDRAPLASDPCNPNLAICGCTNGKGLITFDLRKQQPAHFALNVHSSPIRDIIYLDKSWPFGGDHQGTIVSLSLDGMCKIRTKDDKELHVLDVKHRSDCIAAGPSMFSYSNDESFQSIMLIGGDNLSGYMPEFGNQEARLLTYGQNEKPIHRLRYTSNGHVLYAVARGGQLRRYQRVGSRHLYLGEVYSHNDEIFDMDISPNDEYIVTASKDGNVGLLCLGAPSYGWTGYMQFA